MPRSCLVEIVRCCWETRFSIPATVNGSLREGKQLALSAGDPPLRKVGWSNIQKLHSLTRRKVILFVTIVSGERPTFSRAKLARLSYAIPASVSKLWPSNVFSLLCAFPRFQYRCACSFILWTWDPKNSINFCAAELVWQASSHTSLRSCGKE